MKKAEHIHAVGRIKKSLWGKCLSFAEDCMKTNIDEYCKRNQKQSDTIIKQIAIGKIGEVLDYKWLLRNGFQVVKEPDFNIYSSCQKDFSSDLVVDGGEKEKNYFGFNKDQINISCKTSFYKMGDKYTEYMNGDPIPVKLPYQHSWVYQLQNNDKVTGKDKGNHDLYMFNIVNQQEMTAELYAWVESSFVHKMFVRPFHESLKENKLVIQQKTCGGLRTFPCGIDELI